MKTEHRKEDQAPSFSIEEAAALLDLEPFTVYGLIQRDKIKADRTAWGETVIPRRELEERLGRTVDGFQSNKTDGRFPC